MSLSVIVPVLDEARHIEACLRALRLEHAGEVLVVDGGSRDDTAAKARSLGAEVLAAPRGLASQCNAGAARAKGDVLFFLAGDSRPEPGWRAALEAAVRSPYVAGGGFRLHIDGPGFAYRVITFGGNFRARYLKLALPDQGLFVRREAFEAAGGMPADSIIPFARLCFELRRHGDFVSLPDVVHSSARKWQEHGILKVTLAHARTYLKFKRRELPPHY